jgi:hypothetical protein
MNMYYTNLLLAAERHRELGQAAERAYHVVQPGWHRKAYAKSSRRKWASRRCRRLATEVR